MQLKVNWGFIASLAINVILAMLLFKGCNPFHAVGIGCPDAIVTKHTIDTIRVPFAQIKPEVMNYVPVPKKILPGILIIHDSISVAGEAFNSPASGDGGCNDTAIYDDTLTRPDEYKATITDTVTGNRIVGRRITWYNLTPRIVEHTEKILPDRVKFYAGAFAGFNRPYTGGAWNWSVGPEILITEPHGIAVSYGFDAKNNGHLVSLFYKIKLRK